MSDFIFGVKSFHIAFIWVTQHQSKWFANWILPGSFKAIIKQLEPDISFERQKVELKKIKKNKKTCVSVFRYLRQLLNNVVSVNARLLYVTNILGNSGFLKDQIYLSKNIGLLTQFGEATGVKALHCRSKSRLQVKRANITEATLKMKKL